MSEDKKKEDFKEILNRFQIEIDPDEIEQSIRNLRDKVRQFAADGRYTKVRIKFRGKTILPDIPLSAFIFMTALLT